MAPGEQRRQFCIEVFLPSRAARGSPLSAADRERRQRALARRLAPLNDVRHPLSEGCSTSALLQPDVVVLEVATQTADETQWASAKQRLSEQAATIGEVVRSFAADPDDSGRP